MIQLPKVVLFDDDESNHRFYHNYFKDHFTLQSFQNPFLYERALQNDVDAILLDVIMPIMEGTILYNKIQTHENYNGCPIIFISGSNCEEIMLKTIKAGGHDFLNRRMKKDEMLTRIQNKIDFFKTSRQIFSLGKVKLNTSKLKAYCSSESVDLTLTELKIMRFLISRFPLLSSREEITNEIWSEQKVLPQTLNTHLSNLRNKFLRWEYEIQFFKSRGVGLVMKNQALQI